MLDIAAEIAKFNSGGDAERLNMKYQRMRASPFSFLRGTCHLFHKRLPPGGVLEASPPTWVCGDMHLENFGSYKGGNRLVYFDVNDFDEACLAPSLYEIVRLLTSVLVAARICASAGQRRLRCAIRRSMPTARRCASAKPARFIAALHRRGSEE
jgi:uncharacterized protein (DUF2252 family)